jgi:thiol-disulfide isomerase/thioredoxin
MNEISGINMLNELIYLNKDKLILLYFGAIWCGPCKKLKDKIYEAKSDNEFPNMEIFYLDNDNEDNNEIFEMYNVKNYQHYFL